MDDKELIYQFVGREVGNVLAAINPSLRMFTPMLMNTIKLYVDPYLDMFISPDTSKLNTKAAEGFLKEETGKRIEDFLKRFEAESIRNDKKM